MCQSESIMESRCNNFQEWNVTHWKREREGREKEREKERKKREREREITEAVSTPDPSKLLPVRFFSLSLPF